jgi:DedD protein
MNDHNLDDLIIGDPETHSKNSKTPLTIIALLVVILIVVLILWALIFDSSSTDVDAETSPNIPSQTHSLDPSLTPLDTSGNDMPTLTLDPIQEQVTPAPKPQPKPQPKPTLVVLPDPKPAPVVKPAPTPPPKKAEQQTVAPSSGGELIKNANKTIYYIQVGAFKRDPSPKFMQKLKNAGFTFITKTSKNIRRVRVGPYDSYSEAKAALPVVKEKIGIDGLIVKY